MTTLHSIARTMARSLAVGTLLFASTMLWAQDDDGPGRISVRLVDVRADAVAQFEAAIADIGAVQKAAGRPFFHVYERIRGATGFTVITSDADYNELPAAPLDSDLLDRILHSLNGSTLMTLNIYPQLGIPGAGTTAPSGEFLIARVRTTSPSNRQAYFDFQANELVPALRAAGVTDQRAGRVIAGGNTNTFVRYSFTNDWTDPANPLLQSLGQRDFDRLIARGNALLVNVEDYVYRFREDLSFTAPPQP